MNIILLILSFLLNKINSFNICVVGGNSGLGRELIYQALNKDKQVLALSNSSKNIEYPFRGYGLSKKNSNNGIIKNRKLKVDNYCNSNNYKFDNIIFTLGGQPFIDDYSDIVTNYIINNINHNVKNIILISAYGVGNTLPDSNLGIKIMNNIYLKDVYRAKNKQEQVITEYGEKNKINTLILRPKALSYGPNLLSVQSRENLANEILDFIN
tara:strand:- start:2644 stop:3276 length:633 start_codon:yes stop_codon:yes gene_type:complete